MENEQTGPDAAAALALIQSSRADLADRVVTPWWYHPVLGVMAGGLVAAQALDSAAVRTVCLAGFAAGIGALISAYRRLTGLWINGTHPGPARRWSIALGVAYGAALLGALAVWTVFDWRGGWPIAGALMVPLTIVLGRRYDRALRSDLRRPR